jgi:hypothetical protein
MSEITNFRKIQQRIIQLTSFEDGFWDLLLGIIFLLLAVYPVTRERLGPEWNVVLFLSLLALMVMGQLALRYSVSGPRIGYVMARRSPKLRLLLILTVGLVLITSGLLMLTLLSPRAESASSLPAKASAGRGYMVEIIVLFVLGGLFSLMGYLFRVTRLYFYGWMLGLTNLASIYMEHNAGWTFQIPSAIAAGIILLIGFVLLVRFLRKYPVRVKTS